MQKPCHLEPLTKDIVLQRLSLQVSTSAHSHRAGTAGRTAKAAGLEWTWRPYGVMTQTTKHPLALEPNRIRKC